MKFSSLALALAVSHTAAFTVPSSRAAAKSRLYVLPTPEESAKALSDCKLLIDGYVERISNPIMLIQKYTRYDLIIHTFMVYMD